MLSLDRELLGTLDTVTELYDRKCRVYKMNYPDYVSYGATINAAESAEPPKAENILLRTVKHSE